MMTKSSRCVSTEVRNLLHYDGLLYVELFLDEFEKEYQKNIAPKNWN